MGVATLAAVLTLSPTFLRKERLIFPNLFRLCKKGEGNTTNRQAT
jgi:hypothetical protein